MNKPTQPEAGNAGNEVDDIDDVDSYYDGPFLVFTATYLRKRGTCCGNQCRHCPYDEQGNPVPGKGNRPPVN